MSPDRLVVVEARHWHREPRVWNAAALIFSGMAVYLGQTDLPPAVLHWVIIPLNLAGILTNVVLLVFFNQGSTLPPGAAKSVGRQILLTQITPEGPTDPPAHDPVQKEDL